MILRKIIPNLDLIILCTPISEYQKIILKMNKYFYQKQSLQMLVHQKKEIFEIIKKN